MAALILLHTYTLLITEWRHVSAVYAVCLSVCDKSVLYW